MKEYSEQVISDLNGDGNYTLDDAGGLMYHSNSALQPYLAAANLRLVEKDENDLPYLITDMTGVEHVFSTMQTMMTTTGCTLDWATFPNAVADIQSLIDNKQVLFQNMVLSMLRRLYRDLEANFGLLPLPKFDETQETYSTCYNSAAMLTGIVQIMVRETDNVGFILEAMASASYELTDTYLNVCLESKYTRDIESYEMVKLARENVVIDMSFLYNWGNLGTTLTNAVPSGDSFASKIASLSKVATKTIEKFVEDLNG